MRAGIAYVQLNDKAKAKDAFDQVLTIDKSNALANKHLLKLKNNQKIIYLSLYSASIKSLSMHNFVVKRIEELLFVNKNVFQRFVHQIGASEMCWSYHFVKQFYQNI